MGISHSPGFQQWNLNIRCISVILSTHLFFEGEGDLSSLQGDTAYSKPGQQGVKDLLESNK